MGSIFCRLLAAARWWWSLAGSLFSVQHWVCWSCVSGLSQGHAAPSGFAARLAAKGFRLIRQDDLIGSGLLLQHDMARAVLSTPVVRTSFLDGAATRKVQVWFASELTPTHSGEGRPFLHELSPVESRRSRDSDGESAYGSEWADETPNVPGPPLSMPLPPPPAKRPQPAPAVLPARLQTPAVPPCRGTLGRRCRNHG